MPTNETPQPESFEISAELGNKLTAYLGTRPYQEVAGLIMGLQQAFGAAALPKPTAPAGDTPTGDDPANEGDEPKENEDEQ